MRQEKPNPKLAKLSIWRQMKGLFMLLAIEHIRRDARVLWEDGLPIVLYSHLENRLCSLGWLNTVRWSELAQQRADRLRSRISNQRSSSTCFHANFKTISNNSNNNELCRKWAEFGFHIEITTKNCHLSTVQVLVSLSPCFHGESTERLGVV